MKNNTDITNVNFFMPVFVREGLHPINSHSTHQNQSHRREVRAGFEGSSHSRFCPNPSSTADNR